MEWKCQIMLFENCFVFCLGLECDRLRKSYCRICLVNQYVVIVEWGTAESAFLWLAVVDYLGSVGDDERIIVVLCDKQFRLLAFAYECVFVGAECVQRGASGENQKRKAKRQYFEPKFHSQNLYSARTILWRSRISTKTNFCDLFKKYEAERSIP